MTRRLLGCATAIVLTAVLVGCGGNASSPAPTASNTPPTTTPPAATPPPSTPPPTTPPPAPTPAPSSTPSCNYSYATLKDSNGADARSLYGINDNGAMVGIDSAGHGFIYQGGQYTQLSAPASFNATTGRDGNPSSDVNPTAIANNGLVTGSYTTGSGSNVNTKPFIYNNGQYTSFDVPNSNTTMPTGISSDGTTIGTGHLFAAAYGSNWIRHPDGTFGTLSDGLIPEGLRTPGDINDNDIVVLDASISSAHRNDYATWQNGAFTYHAFPSSIGSGSPLGNNNLGDIVGVNGNNGVLTGWALLGSNTSCAIAYPGAAVTSPEDINGARVIVGHYTVDKVTTHAFIATPK